MSAATVRAAIQTYFETLEIEGINRVYKAPPFWIDGGTFNLIGEGGWGAVLAVSVDHSAETRMTLGARNTINPTAVGQKMVTHDIGLLLIMQWLIPEDGDGNGGDAADLWADAADQMTDAVEAAVRADPNLGTGPALPSPTIWQAGQDEYGISIDRGLPKVDDGGGLLHVMNLIQFRAQEVVTG